MKCQVADCKKAAKWRCSDHLSKFCNVHCELHSKSCESKPSLIDRDQELRSQIRDFETKYFKMKNQIVSIANELVGSVNRTLKITIDSLDKQKKILIEMVKMQKPKSEIKQFLDLFPESIDRGKDVYESFMDFEKKFNIDNFRSKLKAVEGGWYSVAQSLGTLSLRQQIELMKTQGIQLFYEENVNKIQISKNSNYILYCKINEVGKNDFR